MLNPFKKSYKISESSSNSETFYWVRYGWFWGYEFLLPSGNTCSFYSTAEVHGGKFKTISEAEAAIKKHATSLIEKRLGKPTFKTVKYV